MELLILICVSFHLYMVRWGQRAYWREVYVAIATHEPNSRA